jgi:hypothetical protein
MGVHTVSMWSRISCIQPSKAAVSSCRCGDDSADGNDAADVDEGPDAIIDVWVGVGKVVDVE